MTSKRWVSVTLMSSVPGHTWGSIHQDIFSERSLHWTINRADIIYTHGALVCENNNKSRRRTRTGSRVFGVRKLWQWPTSTQRLRPVPLSPKPPCRRLCIYGPKGLLQRTFWPINGNGNVAIESHWVDESGNRASHRTTVGCT